MPRDFYSGGDNVNKRTMKKGLAIVLALVMTHEVLTQPAKEHWQILL